MHHVCRDSRRWLSSLFRELAECSDVTIKNKKGETCIYGLGSLSLFDCSVKQTSSNVVRIMVEGGLDLESRDHFGRTALLAMCKENQRNESIAALVRFGANVKSKGPQNKTCKLNLPPEAAGIHESDSWTLSSIGFTLKLTIFQVFI